MPHPRSSYYIVVVFCTDSFRGTWPEFKDHLRNIVKIKPGRVDVPEEKTVDGYRIGYSRVVNLEEGNRAFDYLCKHGWHGSVIFVALHEQKDLEGITEAIRGPKYSEQIRVATGNRSARAARGRPNAPSPYRGNTANLPTQMIDVRAVRTGARQTPYFNSLSLSHYIAPARHVDPRSVPVQDRRVAMPPSSSGQRYVTAPTAHGGNPQRNSRTSPMVLSHPGQPTPESRMSGRYARPNLDQSRNQPARGPLVVNGAQGPARRPHSIEDSDEDTSSGDDLPATRRVRDVPRTPTRTVYRRERM